MTDATVTFDLFNALGVPFDARRTKVWVTFNTDEGWIVDENGNIRMDAGTATITDAGLVTLTGIPKPGAGTNPTDFQVKVHFDAPVALPGVRSLTHKTGDFGWMTITANGDLTDLIAEQYAPPTWQSQFMAGAQALLDAQILLSTIDDTDSAVAGLISNGSLGPLTRAALNASIASTAVVMFNVRDPAYSAVGDGTANDTAAIAAAIAAAKAAQGLTVLRTTVYFPRGTYKTDAFEVPGGVSLLGEGAQSSTIKNRSTNGGVFIHFKGSFSECRGLRIDGQRAAQASLGLASVQFARSNAVAAGAINISGGVTISAASAGATTLTVNTASPASIAIVPGEYLSLVESTTFELVQVASISGTTITLVNPLANTFTTAATVSVAITGVGIYDCEVLGNGRDGVAFWHTVAGKALNNRVSDYEDTGIDLPSAGSWWVEIGGNVFETKGRWGIAMDTAETYFGPVTECTSHDNVIRFQSGGSFTNGNTIDGIYFGNVVRCKSVNDTVDLTLAGLAGVTYAGSSYGSRDNEVVNLTVKGPATIRSNTFGVRVTIGNADIRPKVIGGNISNVQRGVEFGTTRSGTCVGTHIINVSDFAVNVTSDASNVQTFNVVGIYAKTNVAGVRVGGTGTAGATMNVVGSTLLSSSFASVVSDVNWTVTRDGDVPLAAAIAGLASRTLAGSANASSSLTLSTTATDVPGATITFTAAVAGKAIITGDFDLSNVSNIVVGSLLVDGTAQTGGPIASGTISRVMISRTWVVSLAAGSHTIKLRANTVGGPTSESVGATNTGISYVFVPGS